MSHLEPVQLTPQQLRVELAKVRELFHVYEYDKGFPGDEYWMLWASCEVGGSYSDIRRTSETDCWQFEDMFEAAPPVESDIGAVMAMLEEKASWFEIKQYRNSVQTENGWEFTDRGPTCALCIFFGNEPNNYRRVESFAPTVPLAISMAYYEWKTRRKVELIQSEVEDEQ